MALFGKNRLFCRFWHFWPFPFLGPGFLGSFLKWDQIFKNGSFAVFENVFFTLKFSKNGQFYRPPKKTPIFRGVKNDLKLYTERRWPQKRPINGQKMTPKMAILGLKLAEKKKTALLRQVGIHLPQ